MLDPSCLHLKHLTLDLFVYDLHDGLGETNARIEKRRTAFWSRLYPQGLPSDLLSQIMQRESQDSNLIELLGNQRFLPFPKPEDGYFYPLLLGDTYLTLIDSSGDLCWQGKPQPVEHLSQIRQSLEQRRDHPTEKRPHHPAEIGQSWLIWGQWVTADGDAEAIAQACYQSLMPEAPWIATEPVAGHWQGATLFEQWHPAHHTLIALFPPDHNLKAITKLQRHLAHLLSFRHKILWTYGQSRRLKTTLKQSSSQIQALVDRLPTHLATDRPPLQNLQTDLTTALSLFASYSEQISYLEEHQHTIETNLTNYRDRLETMQREDPAADLRFLREFATYGREKYLKQLSSDYRGLSAGLRLLENTISAIAGISQLEQSKRDRRLNQTIAIAGVGVGTASATASLINPVTTHLLNGDAPTPTASPSQIFGLSLFLSLGIGCIAALIAALLWKSWQRQTSPPPPLAASISPPSNSSPSVPAKPPSPAIKPSPPNMSV